MATTNDAESSVSVANKGYVDEETESDDSSSTQTSRAVHGDDVAITKDKHELKRYGCGPFQPGCLQWLNHPRGYLFFLCAFCFVQGMVVNGLIYVIISTLEKRFNLSSFQSAIISSSYDFTAMFMVVFITYFGERSHKPRLLGIGALIFAVGSVVFTLPQILTGPYDAEAAEFDTCDSNRTSVDPCELGVADDGENVSKFYPVFLAAQGIHALGACGIYTIGLAHVDENVDSGTAAVYTGIFWVMAVVGPSAGFVTGSFYLDIYTDFYATDVTITPESPLWIGAWWFGFLISASLAVLVAIPLLGFNKRLPGYAEAQLQRRNETRTGASFTAKNSLSEFPKAVWTLLKNPTYVFVTAGVVCEAFLLAFMSVFGPKIMESLFNISASTASLIVGITITPAGFVSPLFAGFLLKRFSMNVTQILKLCVGALVTGGLVSLGFILTCPDVPFAGVTTLYSNSSVYYGDRLFNLTASCNINCNCEDIYDPVCGSDGIMYYSACHAGCTGEIEQEGSPTVYTQCACIPPDVTSNSSTYGAAQSGKCGSSCPNLIPFLVVAFGAFLFIYLVPVLSTTVTLRCVDFSQRAFALGIQTFFNKGLGVVPGPIVFGALVDKACLLWEDECDGSRNCWLYDNSQLTFYLVVMIMAFRAGSVLFFTLAFLTYKTPKEELYDKKDVDINQNDVELTEQRKT